MLIELIKDHLNKAEKERAWENGLRASSAGKCTRAIAYQYHGYMPAPLNWRSRLVFKMGDHTESDLVEIVQHYGFSGCQDEVTLTIDGHLIKGHVDGVYQDIVVDFKSINTRGFKEVVKKSDTKGYEFQMHFYMKALGLKNALLVFYNKDTSALHEVLVPWNDFTWEVVETKFRAVLQSTPTALPDRDYRPNDKGTLPWQCSYCAFNHHCYPEYQLAFDEDGKPSLSVTTSKTADKIKTVLEKSPITASLRAKLNDFVDKVEGELA